MSGSAGRPVQTITSPKVRRLLGRTSGANCRWRLWKHQPDDDSLRTVSGSWVVDCSRCGRPIKVVGD